MSPRFFTLREANDVLPWLRRQLSEMQPLQVRANELALTVMQLTQMAASNGHSDIGLRIEKSKKELEEANAGLAKLFEGVQERGIILRDPSRGLVDFPSLDARGTEIYLCWLLGEDTIGFWHTPDSGFAGRQPL